MRKGKLENIETAGKLGRKRERERPKENNLYSMTLWNEKHMYWKCETESCGQTWQLILICES